MDNWDCSLHDMAYCVEEGWGCFNLDYMYTLATFDDIVIIVRFSPWMY